VGKSVNQGCRECQIADRVHPFGELKVCSHIGAFAFVANREQLKEHRGLRWRQMQVAELVKDKQIAVLKGPHLLTQFLVVPCFDQLIQKGHDAGEAHRKTLS
jgi:hypothetical protein